MTSGERSALRALSGKRRAAGAAAAALALCLLVAGAQAATTDKPDLVPLLPSTADTNQVAPMYVDAYENPGHLLYRFDAVIKNQGGALDVYRDSSGTITQVVWPGGTPASPPDPNSPPSDPGAVLENRTTSGASFDYPGNGHDHWHMANIVKYELLLPGDGSKVGPVNGDCMSDSWGTANYFKSATQGPERRPGAPPERRERASCAWASLPPPEA